MLGPGPTDIGIIGVWDPPGSAFTRDIISLELDLVIWDRSCLAFALMM